MKYLDFNDILLMPESTSSIDSRKNVEIEVDGIVPISAANMETIGKLSVSSYLTKHKWKTYISKNESMQNWKHFFQNTSLNDFKYVIPTFGILQNDIEKANEIWYLLTETYGSISKTFCFDVANGHSKFAIEQVISFIKSRPINHLVFGNIGNPRIISHILNLLEATNLDYLKTVSFKVGIGSGSVCTTRLMTGVGVPQFSLVKECREAVDSSNEVKKIKSKIISDGGCRVPGDIVKAFIAGAHEVMIGGMLAGTYETGEIFYGSASENSSLHNSDKKYCTPEGKCVTIRRDKSIEDVIQQVEGGLRSALSYIDSSSLIDIINYPRDFQHLIIEVNKQVDNYA